MTDNTQPNQPSALMNQAGIANRVIPSKAVYMRNSDMKAFEQELETSRTNQGNPTNQAPEVNVPNENPIPTTESNQEVVPMKRYSDLQSDRDKKLADKNKIINDKDSEIKALKDKLAVTNSSKPRYPTSEEELATWVKDFPPLLPIIQTIALKSFEGDKQEIMNEIAELKQVTQAYANEKGRAELLKVHPDANEIENDPRFSSWFNEQEPEIQALIPEKGGDPKKIAKAITLYKKDMGIVTKTALEVKKEASKAINLGPTPADLPQEQRQWSESMVKKLTDKQYAHYEKEIELARIEGRFVYDLTRA